MLIQESISGPAPLLKLYAAIDDRLKRVQGHLVTQQFPRDPRGGRSELSAAAVLTMLVWGAWRGLGDKAKPYYYLRGYQQQEVHAVGSYRKFVEATKR